MSAISYVTPRAHLRADSKLPFLPLRNIPQANPPWYWISIRRYAGLGDYIAERGLRAWETGRQIDLLAGLERGRPGGSRKSGRSHAPLLATQPLR